MNTGQLEFSNPKQQRFKRAIFLLWVSFVAFALPEIIAGTGAGWWSQLFVFILVIPLYGTHFLLLTHIAVRTRRTSWSALYVFGLIFGLYETWVTKVIWNGYPGQGGFAMGGFGQWFGVHETLGLTLFYHAVTSFLLPIVVLSVLFPTYGRHFPKADWLLAKTRWGFVRRLGLLLIWGGVSGHNMPNVGVYLTTWLPALGLGAMGYWYLAKSKAKTDNQKAIPTLATLATPILGRWGLGIVTLILALIYLITYGGLLPEKLPPAWVQLLTMTFYPVLLLALKFLPARDTEPVAMTNEDNRAQKQLLLRWLMAVFFLGLIISGMISAGGLFPMLTLTISTFAFISMVIVGVFLFLWLVLRPLIMEIRSSLTVQFSGSLEYPT